MSLLVVSAPPMSIMDRLSPGWISRSMSRRKKSPDSRPTTSSSQVSPRPSRTSSTSNDSRQSKSGSRTIRGMVNRIRSVSNASVPKDASKELDFKEVDEWFTGFQRYNQLITQTEQPYRSSEFTKASKQLTKNCGGNFIHGLPEALFDFSLLWCPADASTSRNTDEPSWSWTSHAGPINFPFDPTSCPDTYTLPRDTGEIFRSEVQNYLIGPQSTPYTIRRDKHNSLRIRYPPYFHAPRGTDPTLDSCTLRFSALAISADGFTASQLHYQGAEMPCSQLIDPEGHHVGVVMAHETSISAPHYDGPFEFVLLSRNKRVDPAEHTRKPQVATMHPPNTPVWDGERFVWDEEVVDFDEEIFQNGEWCVLNVLLIRWDEARGVAERVAVARLHEDAWAKLGPQRKEVVLR
ncbi:heterokaryon incompatibility protein [Stagonosporopsis vannaccii]|nr:heterokaryon incompatibility protein [Stagonosporopsis vannaccii]